MPARTASAVAVFLALLALAGCRAPLPQPSAPGAPATGPVEGAVLYGVDAAASQVLIRVYRDGPLASLGHNHVIAVHGLRGRVQSDARGERASFELQFDVADLGVDEPTLRAAEGPDFTSSIGEAQREGTRNNMLGERLLDATRNRAITLQSVGIVASGAGFIARTRVIVRGREALLSVPVSLQRDADRLMVSGEFSLRHSELGLTPYSVALGALRVADEMRIRYRIVARRVALP